jgi:hypothetical protein
LASSSVVGGVQGDGATLLINGSGVIALNLANANVWTAQQTDQGATTTSPGFYSQITGDTTARVRVGLNGTDVASVAFGSGSATRDTFLERAGVATLRHGGPDAAAPVPQIETAQNVIGGTSNTAGAIWEFLDSAGTGNAASGGFEWCTHPLGSSGTGQNSPVCEMTLSSAGLLTVPGLDVTTSLTLPSGSVSNAALANSAITVNGTAISLGASGTVAAAAGTLTGSTLAAGVTASSLTSVGTLAGLTVTGSLTATGLITNGDLANSATTVNGTSCTLGSTCTATAAAGTLTGTALNSTVVTSSLTSLGTIGTGVWQGTLIGATYGGTGVNNGSKTITLGGSLTTTGAATPTLAFGATGYTFTFPGAAANLAALNITDQTLTGGVTPTAYANTTGSITVDCGKGPQQYVSNNGAFTITAPTTDGNCILLIRNTASAGAVTFSGFTVGSNTGATMVTTSGNIYTVMIWRVTDATGAVAGYNIFAHQ